MLAVGVDFVFCEDSQVPVLKIIHSFAVLSVNFNRCEWCEVQVKPSSVNTNDLLLTAYKKVRDKQT